MKKPMSKEQQDRLGRWTRRMDLMLKARRPFEKRIRRSLLLYSGQSLDREQENVAKYVSPMAYVFVESSTAHMARAMSEFSITPVERSGDAWKVPNIKDAVDHAEAQTQWQSKRIQMLRMMSIAGVSIGRVGHRLIEGKRKIGTSYDESGRMLDWVEKTIPVYDGLFIDIVPPLDFLVDPNATSMADAMDCVALHAEHIDEFREIFGNDDRFNIKDVEAGEHDMVGIAECFNKTLDEWVPYAFPYSSVFQGSIADAAGNWREIGNLGLPDDHDMLPFFSYHCFSTFADSPQVEGVRRTTTGELTSSPMNVRSHETFWSEGIPSKIEELVKLRTDFGRSAFRALDLAGQSIFLTSGEYSLDTAIPWHSGKQAIGGLNKVQVVSPGGATSIASFEFIFRDIYEQMVLVVGIDPRNLFDSKQKTATESRIQAESSMVRIALVITFNEEHGETIRGILLVKDVQQYISKPEMIRLTGKEDVEQLDLLEDWEGVKKNGKTIPYRGMRMRSIPTKRNVREMKAGKEKYLAKGRKGDNWFLASPEYIRTSEIDIRVIPKRRAEQMDSVVIEDLTKAFSLLLQAYPLTVSTVPGQPPAIDAAKLPDIGKVLKELLSRIGIEMMDDDEKEDGEFEKAVSKLKEMRTRRKPLNASAAPVKSIPL